MTISLGEHFTYKKLFRFTLPSVAMMVFTSIYGVVDGFFVSNFVGKVPYTAVNFIYPFIMVLGAFGFMFGTGGSALIGKILGEGERERANSVFSLLIYTSLISGVVIAVLGIIFLPDVARLLGAEGELLHNSVIYGSIILAAMPAFMLQYAFQSLFVTAEKPQLGLAFTVAAGITNMVLDALLTAIFPLGIAGAAAATAISQCVGGFLPLIYFFSKNKSLLRLGRARFDGKALWITCSNGSSELLSNISMSLVGMLYNARLMKYAGEDGVAAYGTLMYVTMIFLAIFIGYVVGTSPIVSYNYGAGNTRELKSLFKKSLVIIGVSSVAMLAAGEILARPLSLLFVSYDATLLEMTLRAFRLYSFSFLFSGMAIYGSSFFTALNNGPVSALISFLRTVVFQVGAVIIFPLIWELDGIWLSVVAAELSAAAIAIILLIIYKKRYKYA